MAQAVASANKKEEVKGYPIELYVYDLSGGLARIYSQQLVGKVIEGIWHSSIVVYGHEYFYGGGIQSARAKTTPYGQPVKEFKMGNTFIPQSVFHDFLREVSPKYSPDKYDLIHNNCNNFTNEATQFLLGKDIPDFITGLPHEFLKTPFGQMVQPIIQNMQNQALANFGDYAGMGIAVEPHLPRVNPNYDKFIGESDADTDEDDNENDNGKQNDNNNSSDKPKQQDNKKEKCKDEEQQAQQDKSKKQSNEELLASAASQEVTVNTSDEKKDNDIDMKNGNNNNNDNNNNESKNSLNGLIDEYCNQHSNYKLKESFQVIGSNEFHAKLTLDNKNAKLYAEMVLDSNVIENARQAAHIQQLVKYIERKDAARKKGLNIILQMTDDALEALDELMLTSSDEQLFPLIALLKLLIIYPKVFSRYKDLMIVNQILYRIGIPFTDEEKEEQLNDVNVNNDENNEKKKNENKENENEEKEQVVPNLHLLQFNALCALSHLYNDELVEIKNNVIALGLAGLKIEQTQVRLAATRLLFNILLQCKRQYLIATYDGKEDNRDSDAIKDKDTKIGKLLKQMVSIGRAFSNHLDSETHEPTRYRCLVGLSVLLYCNESQYVSNHVKLNMDEWQKKDQVSICKDAFNDLDFITK